MRPVAGLSLDPGRKKKERINSRWIKKYQAQEERRQTAGCQQERRRDKCRHEENETQGCFQNLSVKLDVRKNKGDKEGHGCDVGGNEERETFVLCPLEQKDGGMWCSADVTVLTGGVGVTHIKTEGRRDV